MNIRQLVNAIQRGYSGMIYKDGRKYYLDSDSYGLGYGVPLDVARKAGVKFICFDGIAGLMAVEIEFVIKNRFKDSLCYNVVE